MIELPEVVPYFDLESFPGVEELRREKDTNSEPINIPLGLLFGDRIVTTAYVSSWITTLYKVSCSKSVFISLFYIFSTYLYSMDG